MIPNIISVIPNISSISLTWTKIITPGLSRGYYTIQYSTNNGSSWTTYATKISLSSTTTTIYSLNPNLFYIFKICITDSKGVNGPFSSQTSPVKPLSSLPSVPLNFKAINNIGSIKLDWTKPTNSGSTPIVEYKIEYSSNNGNSWTAITSISSNVSTHIIPGLANGTTYLCRISAKNQSGYGPTSSPISVLVFAPPASPVKLSVGSVTDGGAFVSWTPPLYTGGKPIVDYAIRCAGFKTLKEAQNYIPTPQNITPFELSRRRFNNTDNIDHFFIDNLTNGLFYAFTIRAFNVGGTEAYNVPGGSSVWSNKVIANPAGLPNQPTNLQIIGVGNGSVTISWTPPSNTGGINVPLLDYIIQYNDGDSWTTYNDGYNTNTSATIRNLTNGVSYTFRVAAINIIGTGTYSDLSRNAVPGSAPPDPPTSITGSSRNRAVQLSWTPPNTNGGLPILNYIIQQSSDNGQTWSIANGGFATTSSNSILIVGLTNGLSYKFRVAASNIIGIGSYSVSSSAIIPQPQPPQTVRNFRAAPGISSAILSWEAPSSTNGSPITGYIIQQSILNSGVWTTVTTVSSTDTTYVVSNLTPTTVTYIFRVAAINSIGTGTYTNSDPVVPELGNKLFDLRFFDSKWDAGVLLGMYPENIRFLKTAFHESVARLSKYLKMNEFLFTAAKAYCKQRTTGCVFDHKMKLSNADKCNLILGDCTHYHYYLEQSLLCKHWGLQIYAMQEFTFGTEFPSSHGNLVLTGDYELIEKTTWPFPWGIIDLNYVVECPAVPSPTGIGDSLRPYNNNSYLVKTGTRNELACAVKAGQRYGFPTGKVIPEGLPVVEWDGCENIDLSAEDCPDSDYLGNYINCWGSGIHGFYDVQPPEYIPLLGAQGEFQLPGYAAPYYYGGDFLRKHGYVWHSEYDIDRPSQSGPRSQGTEIHKTHNCHECPQIVHVQDEWYYELHCRYKSPWCASWYGSRSDDIASTFFDLPQDPQDPEQRDQFEPWEFDGLILTDLFVGNLDEDVLAWCEDGIMFHYKSGHPSSTKNDTLIPLTFKMGINTKWASRFTYQNWVDIISHELCHALGLGGAWLRRDDNLGFRICSYKNSCADCYSSTYNGAYAGLDRGPGRFPRNYAFLNHNGIYYPETQQAYNEITGLSRSATPVEGYTFYGQSYSWPGTTLVHWEDDYRPPVGIRKPVVPEPFCNVPNETKPEFYGLWDELMIGWAPNPGERRVLSKLTIKNLVDLGYEEINPGASEGDPTLITQMPSFSTSSHDNNERIRMGCRCGGHHDQEHQDLTDN